MTLMEAMTSNALDTAITVLIVLLGLWGITGGLLAALSALARTPHGTRRPHSSRTSHAAADGSLLSWMALPTFQTYGVPSDEELEQRVRLLAAQHRLPPGWSEVDALRLVKIRARRARLLHAEHGPQVA
ncbi:MAG: hypothetical protein HY332_01820 [Chloroflexi bacterium]|nr:hypothetical protein [Chloroflexota bacterium]